MAGVDNLAEGGLEGLEVAITEERHPINLNQKLEYLLLFSQHSTIIVVIQTFL